MPPTTQLQKEMTLSYLEKESEVFLGLKRRYERSAGLDSSINKMYEDSSSAMNQLLEDLFALNVLERAGVESERA